MISCSSLLELQWYRALYFPKFEFLFISNLALFHQRLLKILKNGTWKRKLFSLEIVGRTSLQTRLSFFSRIRREGSTFKLFILWFVIPFFLLKSSFPKSYPLFLYYCRNHQYLIDNEVKNRIPCIPEFGLWFIGHLKDCCPNEHFKHLSPPKQNKSLSAFSKSDRLRCGAKKQSQSFVFFERMEAIFSPFVNAQPLCRFP